MASNSDLASTNTTLQWKLHVEDIKNHNVTSSQGDFAANPSICFVVILLGFFWFAFGSLLRARFCDPFGVAPWGHSQCHRIHPDLRANPFQESKIIEVMQQMEHSQSDPAHQTYIFLPYLLTLFLVLHLPSVPSSGCQPMSTTPIHD